MVVCDVHRQIWQQYSPGSTPDDKQGPLRWPIWEPYRED
jgi:hypothetical protein